MNMQLYYSSLIITYVHCLGVYIFAPGHILPVYIYALGLITSIINHRFTNTLVKHMDRSIITCAFFMNLYIGAFLTSNLLLGFCICICALLGAFYYFVGKTYNLHHFHFLTHIFVTSSNLFIMAA